MQNICNCFLQEATVYSDNLKFYFNKSCNIYSKRPPVNTGGLYLLFGYDIYIGFTFQYRQNIAAYVTAVYKYLLYVCAAVFVHSGRLGCYCRGTGKMIS